uniref:NADH-ubiquinone oxidoreductase chain 6 n=1 Tax=Staphylinidae sp. BMNH 1274679 TaxID=1796593 RepID=A0A140EG16_9COLE|nr:NADH dehydrogenase subunit 6 [Staphylinidae sp. BMNH 1274679]
MIMTLSMLISIMFLFMNHPMTMGLTLLIQTIIMSMITGMLNYNYWFSYILFLIMVGGMLVLFIYMTSIASNEMFNYSNKMLFMLMMIMIMLIFINFIIDKYMMNYNFIFMENFFVKMNYMYLSKYFSYPSIIIIVMMIIYLFITLIAIVKITKIEYGPLRQKF